MRSTVCYDQGGGGWRYHEAGRMEYEPTRPPIRFDANPSHTRIKKVRGLDPKPERGN